MVEEFLGLMLKRLGILLPILIPSLFKRSGSEWEAKKSSEPGYSLWN